MNRTALALLACALIVAAPAALSQVTYVDNTTVAPTPGDGHSYVKMLSETVNPGNGSVSIRVEAPTPKDRALNYPFWPVAYDSSGQNVPKPIPVNNGQTMTVGWTWSNTEPNTLSYSSVTRSYQNPPGPGATCTYIDNYVYTDPWGGRHSYQLYHVTGYTGLGCGFFGLPSSDSTWIAGDSHYRATVAYFSSVASNGSTPGQDSNGNYNYVAPTSPNCPGVPKANNGYPAGTLGYTDTMGRAAITCTSTSITVSGQGGAYQYTLLSG